MSQAQEQITSGKKLFVRVKPYDPARGHVRIRHNIGGTRFDGGPEPQWYEVSRGQAEKLRQIHQDPDDLRSPGVFDVCTDGEMREITIAEQRAKLGIKDKKELLGVLAGDTKVASMESEPPIDFANVAIVDPLAPEPRGKTRPPNAGDLQTDELKTGQTDNRGRLNPKPKKR